MKNTKKTIIGWVSAIAASPLILASFWFGAAVHGQQDQVFTAVKSNHDPMKIKAQDNAWNEAPAQIITLMAQPMVLPRPKLTLTQNIKVQSLHNGKSIAFRLNWQDNERSDAGILGKFSDAVAMEFPVLLDKGQPPSPFMGEVGKPVQIFHWRAQYQKDMEMGRHPEMTDLYPNMSIDGYPLEYKDKDAPQSSEKARRQFSPGQAAGNPQSYKKHGVDEIFAEGFGSSSVANSIESRAEGVWQNGEWSVVISRPLKSTKGSELIPGQKNFVCFAVWQGGANEVGSRKSVSLMWVDLAIKP